MPPAPGWERSAGWYDLAAIAADGMHIPDGYLSPSTCAALYAAAAPFWSAALRRLRRLMTTRALPLLALFAAFSFVVMMFNIPLPGGTTGHAIGVTIAAIVLGPWGAMVAVSVALAIQALFFGDGGITALGANCFNMAIVGSFVASGVYRLFVARAPTRSRRRLLGAAVAGYLAVNAAALLTALEFGIQPLLFHDASGAPLYAPYPLSIAVPAMMLGHLTIAGLAEALVTVGIVAWLQRAEPSLLEAGAALVPAAPRSMRALWAGLAVALLLTPLGLVAAGTAWGEWSVEDLADSAKRAEIAKASLGVAPPAQAPAGLETLSSLWTAPVSDYAPPFMRSKGFGYLLSAMFGAGLVILTTLLLALLLKGKGRTVGEGEPV